MQKSFLKTINLLYLNIKKPHSFSRMRFLLKLWLEREDSNLRMPAPKTGALPLGDAPTIFLYFSKFIFYSYVLSEPSKASSADIASFAVTSYSAIIRSSISVLVPEFSG